MYIQSQFHALGEAKAEAIAGFDRDLGVAGRVMVRDGSGLLVSRLVKIERPGTTSIHTS